MRRPFRFGGSALPTAEGSAVRSYALENRRVYRVQSRQRHGEGRAVAFPGTLGVNRAVVQFDQVADDREAEAEPAM